MPFGAMNEFGGFPFNVTSSFLFSRADVNLLAFHHRIIFCVATEDQ
jgi:hypothetical protein